MIVIADNLNTRNKAYMEAVKRRNMEALSEFVKRLSHTDMINVQCSLDGSGDEEDLPWVVGVVLETTEKDICLDSRNIKALKNSIPLCKRPPLINYISGTEPEEQEELLQLVSDSGASLVIRASRATPPTTLEAKLLIIEELLEMANSADIPNERLFADPSVVHIGRGVGQEHLANSTECIKVLKDLIEPPIKTIAWISNVSVGMPAALRKKVEAAFFCYFSGAGLDAAMVDVLDENLRKAIYLVKSFKNEIVFSLADIS
ncbi:MAG: dihydropteroate synthase [Thermodesulfovibrionales bacterium]|nr:dihydropteroate synthase [Thermodesulfovibrionales bacterium]